MSCPYCEIKENAKIKTRYDAINISEGTCICGAHIDAGQMRVDVNGYADIYKGALKLAEGLVGQFKEALEYLGIDLEDIDPDEMLSISLSTREIVEKLFLPSYGGTTIGNFKRALGIEETYIDFDLSAEAEK